MIYLLLGKCTQLRCSLPPLNSYYMYIQGLLQPSCHQQIQTMECNGQQGFESTLSIDSPAEWTFHHLIIIPVNWPQITHQSDQLISVCVWAMAYCGVTPIAGNVCMYLQHTVERASSTCHWNVEEEMWMAWTTRKHKTGGMYRSSPVLENSPL